MTAKVLVETVMMYRMRYVIEAPDDHPEYALDTVTCDEGVEFSQLPLGETITSSRVISDDEFFKLFDEDNAYLTQLTDEEKLTTALTRVDQDD